VRPLCGRAARACCRLARPCGRHGGRARLRRQSGDAGTAPRVSPRPPAPTLELTSASRRLRARSNHGVGGCSAPCALRHTRSDTASVLRGRARTSTHRTRSSAGSTTRPRRSSRACREQGHATSAPSARRSARHQYVSTALRSRSRSASRAHCFVR
jgi:hypothetical protein